MFVADRVLKRYLSCVQAYSAVGITALRTIFEVAFDRTAYRGQLTADLVMATGLKIDFEHRIMFSNR